MTDPITRLTQAASRSQTLHLAVIGFLAVVLMIPLLLVGELVNERQKRRDGAVVDIAGSWGGEQAVAGPALVVPYSYSVPVSGPDGSGTRTEHGSAVFLPDKLHFDGDVAVESRRRGIFSVPVYTVTGTLTGEFSRPNVSEIDASATDVEWNRTRLALGISDLRAINSDVTVDWNGSTAAFLPGGTEAIGAATGINARVTLTESGNSYAFSIPISLKGSTALSIAPFGRNTTVALRANTGDPSFRGRWLPDTREISATNFSASWSVPFLGRNYPQSWTASTPMVTQVDQSLFGVALVNPVDEYVMARRSVRYGALFIILTFGIVWLFEVTSGARVHPIQYLQLGAGLCLFYLLELSLAEHIGFSAAYLLAATSVVLMTALYSRSALRDKSRALAMGGAVTALYGYLFVVLRSEDYALLLGSVGLFVILAGFMYATSRVEWYRGTE